MTKRGIMDRMLSSSKLSRRKFMATALASGLTVSAASLLWSSRASAASKGEGQPKRGGHLRAALDGGSTSDTFDPTAFSGLFLICISRAIRDNLVDLGLSNSLRPALAESWKSSADAKIWRFKLRRGVEFSNGKSLTTDDVIASINAHRGEASRSTVKGLFESVANVVADGPEVVVFELNSGNVDFPYLLTDDHVPIVPSNDGKPDLVSSVGTGLYTLKEFEPGVRATLERNPVAWQQSELGFFDEASILNIADPSARQTAIRAGQVDVISRPDMTTIRFLKREPSVNVVATTSNKHYTMPMRVNVPPFDQVNVRKALKHAIDRSEFMSKVLYGYGTMGNDQPIGAGFRYHNPALAQHEYDPDKAKFYLKKTSLDSLDVDYYVADVAFAGAVDGGILFKENAARAGINVNINREPNDGYWSHVWNKKPFCASYWASRPIEDMILSNCYLSTSPRNETNFKNAKLDQLIIGARGELDEVKRRQMYYDVQEIINGEGGTIVPAFAQDVMVINDKIATSGEYGSGGEMDGGHFIARWWMA